jgi:protein SCO1/2
MKPIKILTIILIIFFMAGGVLSQGTSTPDSSSSKMDHSMPDSSKPDSSKPDNPETDHSKMDHSAMDTGDTTNDKSSSSKMDMDAGDDNVKPEQLVKIDEQLGKYAALDTEFTDENGKPVKLETIFNKPVVLLPIYFVCTAVCNFLQADLTDAMNFVDQIPGKDFNIISVSFSDDEDHTHAYTSKRNYRNLLKRDFPMENWFYLTGDKENIRKLTDSLGYYFIKKRPNFYIHPSALIVLAKDGKIIRYLYGPDFLPFDLGMAINEATRGEPGISIKRGVMSFCFDYDPKNKTYVFKIFRITGSAILILLLGFLFFLLSPSKRDKNKKTDSSHDT